MILHQTSSKVEQLRCRKEGDLSKVWNDCGTAGWMHLPQVGCTFFLRPSRSSLAYPRILRESPCSGLIRRRLVVPGILATPDDATSEAPEKFMLQQVHQMWGRFCVTAISDGRSRASCWYACRTGHTRRCHSSQDDRMCACSFFVGFPGCFCCGWPGRPPRFVFRPRAIQAQSLPTLNTS